MKAFMTIILLTISSNTFAQENISYLEKLKKAKSQLEYYNNEKYPYNEIQSILDSLSLFDGILIEVDSTALDNSKIIKKGISNISSIEKQQRSISTSALVSSINSYLGKDLRIDGVVQSIGKALNDKSFILLSNNVKCIFSKGQQLEVLKMKYGSQISIKGEVNKSGGEIVVNNASFIKNKNTSDDKAKILDSFRNYLGNLIIVFSDKMKNIIEINYRKAIEYYANKKYTIALKNFENVSKFGYEFHDIHNLTDSANTFIPYIKALILEDEGNYYNASIIFEEIYNFKNAKNHMRNCLIKYYNKKSEHIVSTKNDSLLLILFKEIHDNIRDGKDKIFYDSLYKQAKSYYEPIVKSWIIGDQTQYIQIPSFNALVGNEWHNTPDFFINPHEFSYDNLVCFCVFNNEDSALTEWNAVQSYNGGIDCCGKYYGYYEIKHFKEISYSKYYDSWEKSKKIEKWLGLHFMNDLEKEVLGDYSRKRKLSNLTSDYRLLKNRGKQNIEGVNWD